MALKGDILCSDALVSWVEVDFEFWGLCDVGV